MIKKLLKSKKRDKKIIITDVAISKVPLVKYKEIDKKEYKHLQYLAQQVLIYAKLNNLSNEVAFVYKLGEKEFDLSNVGVTKGKEHDVDPFSSTIAFHLLKTSRDCVLVCLHNHPSNSIISLADIFCLLIYDNVKMIVVVTNQGSINYIVKSKKYNKNNALKIFREAAGLNDKAKTLKQFQDAVLYFLKRSKNAGIVYSCK